MLLDELLVESGQLLLPSWRECLERATEAGRSAGGKAWRGKHWAKVLCAALDVHDCTKDILYKDVRGDFWALTTFNKLTKELQDGFI